MSDYLRLLFPEIVYFEYHRESIQHIKCLKVLVYRKGENNYVNGFIHLRERTYGNSSSMSWFKETFIPNVRP